MRNYPNADIDILRHILKYCDNIEALIARFGSDIEVFKADLAFRDSVSMNILQIGELTGHLSDAYRSQTKDKMPWFLFGHSSNGNTDTSICFQDVMHTIAYS